jgi:hypothetical protein
MQAADDNHDRLSTSWQALMPLSGALRATWSLFALACSPPTHAAVTPTCGPMTAIRACQPLEKRAFFSCVGPRWIGILCLLCREHVQLSKAENQKGKAEDAEGSNERPHEAWWKKFFCDLKVSDVAISYFTFCLVVVGVFQALYLLKALKIPAWPLKPLGLASKLRRPNSEFLIRPSLK